MFLDGDYRLPDAAQYQAEVRLRDSQMADRAPLRPTVLSHARPRVIGCSHGPQLSPLRYFVNHEHLCCDID